MSNISENLDYFLDGTYSWCDCTKGNVFTWTEYKGCIFDDTPGHIVTGDYRPLPLPRRVQTLRQIILSLPWWGGQLQLLIHSPTWLSGAALVYLPQQHKEVQIKKEGALVHHPNKTWVRQPDISMTWIPSRYHTHPSHSQTSHHLSSSLSVGIPFSPVNPH